MKLNNALEYYHSTLDGTDKFKDCRLNLDLMKEVTSESLLSVMEFTPKSQSNFEWIAFHIITEYMEEVKKEVSDKIKLNRLRLLLMELLLSDYIDRFNMYIITKVAVLCDVPMWNADLSMRILHSDRLDELTRAKYKARFKSALHDKNDVYHCIVNSNF